MDIHISDRLRGQLPYPFKGIDQRVAELKKAGIEPIDFGVGDPISPPSDEVVEAFTPMARKHATSGYPSYFGSAAFRAAVAEYMRKRFGVGLDPETEICSTIGSKEAIFNFSKVVLNPGDTAIVPSPGYPPMRSGTLFAGGEVVSVPLLESNQFLIDYASIPDSVADEAKVLWLNYPNSPTGAVADRDYYEGLIQWARQHEVILAADEGCFTDIYFDRPPPSILESAREGIFTFHSLSKRNNMVGYRVGFVAGDSRIVSAFKQLKTNIDSGTPNFIQEAAILALQDEALPRALSQEYQAKATILLDALSKAGMETRMPSATFHIWQKAPAGMDGQQFAQRLLRKDLGIVVTPGHLISEECRVPTAGGGTQRINPGDQYVRFALVPPLERVEEAAQRIMGAYGSYAGRHERRDRLVAGAGSQAY